MRRDTISQQEFAGRRYRRAGRAKNGCRTCRRLMTCSPGREQTIMKHVAERLKHKQMAHEFGVTAITLD
jgi:FixJ family two-component response regulator